MESKYPTIVNKHKDVFRQIDKAIEFRNKLAYCILVTADESLAENYTARIHYSIVMAKDKWK
jgi:hypothetical protein